jgi:hypothetical protein
VTIGELLETAREVIGSDAELVWAPAEVLGMEFGIRFRGCQMVCVRRSS